MQEARTGVLLGNAMATAPRRSQVHTAPIPVAPLRVASHAHRAHSNLIRAPHHTHPLPTHSYTYPRSDVMPEIMDGKNVADFVDPDIAAKLDALER